MIETQPPSPQPIDFDESVAGLIARADRIISGALAPGSRLMQDHLAKEFGASDASTSLSPRRAECLD